MGLIIDKTVQVIDTTQIAVGDLIYISKSDWAKGRYGVVTAVSPAMIKVDEALPDAGGTLARFTISATEIASGVVEMRWSKDLKTINSMNGGGIA